MWKYLCFDFANPGRVSVLDEILENIFLLLSLFVTFYVLSTIGESQTNLPVQLFLQSLAGFTIITLFLTLVLGTISNLIKGYILVHDEAVGAKGLYKHFLKTYVFVLIIATLLYKLKIYEYLDFLSGLYIWQGTAFAIISAIAYLLLLGGHLLAFLPISSLKLCGQERSKNLLLIWLFELSSIFLLALGSFFLFEQTGSFTSLS